MSRNALRKHLISVAKKEQMLHQIMEVDNYESFLWDKDISNYKKYPIDKIAGEILWLTPFRSKGLEVLIEYVERRMATTKPHRGDLYKAINRQFIKQRSKGKQKKQIEKADREFNVVSNKVTIVANEFDMELVKEIYDNNVPKTDAAYKENKAAHKRMIDWYESKGNHKTVQTLKDDPVIPEQTYKSVAHSLKSHYLKKYDDLPKQKLKEALRLKIKEVSEFAYPKRKYNYPTDEDQPNDDF